MNIRNPKVKRQTEQLFKCYRCGLIINTKVKFCPKCFENGIHIQMIVMMENE